MNSKHFREKAQFFSEFFINQGWYKPALPFSEGSSCSSTSVSQTAWDILMQITCTTTCPSGSRSRESATPVSGTGRLGFSGVSAHIYRHCLGQLQLLEKLFSFSLTNLAVDFYQKQALFKYTKFIISKFIHFGLMLKKKKKKWHPKLQLRKTCVQ